MKKIVFVPLDERPCTYDYPNMLASMAKDVNFVEIPREMMGNIKKAGNIKAIDNFLFEQCKDADYAIVAIDTLLYGGIVPSRLHYDDVNTLTQRLDILRKIKEVNPKIKLYSYHLIMRCPSGNGCDEEPDYYALCGRAIHMIGWYSHLETVRQLNEDETKDYESYKAFIKDNNYQQYVDDYTFRRKINTEMNIKALELVEEKIVDFHIIPQDDSAEFGFTAIDQIKVRKVIEEKRLGLNVLMYPDADAVGSALLSRAINDMNNKHPLVFVRYNTSTEGNLIPEYEDRPVSESIKYQIMAAGGMQTFDYQMADIVLMVNCPQYGMIGARHLYDAIKFGNGEDLLQYTVGRNMVEYIEYIKYLISIKKPVCVADIAYSNGGDTVLFNIMKNEKLLYKVDGYAGWNTSANTLGTCIPLTMIETIYGKGQEFYDFMGLRYLEDVGYQANVRFDAFDKFRNEFKWGLIDGKSDGKVATFIRKGLEEFANKNLNDDYKVTIVKHEQPWNRFFETGLIVKTTKN